MSGLDTIDCRCDDPGVLDVDAPVMVEVVHDAIAVIVDEDVRRVAVHVSAETGSTGWIATASVVLRPAESPHHVHTVDANSVRLEIPQHQLPFGHVSPLQHEGIRAH